MTKVRVTTGIIILNYVRQIQPSVDFVGVSDGPVWIFQLAPGYLLLAAVIGADLQAALAAACGSEDALLYPPNLHGGVEFWHCIAGNDGGHVSASC